MSGRLIGEAGDSQMYSMILLAAGSGSRMGHATPKQFHLLAGRPIIMHSLERFERIREIVEVIVVVQHRYRSIIEDYVEKFRLKKNIKIVEGGDSRQSSVYKGLQASSCENVVIHESARPFVRVEDFQLILRDEQANVTFGRSIPYTVLKCASGYISGALNRSELVNVQLPQKFDGSTLLRAHEMALKDGVEFTEDAGLLFHYGMGPVKVIPGDDCNIKITTPVDLVLAENIYRNVYGAGE